MYAQVKAVRVRDLPIDLSRQGVVCWMGAEPVKVLGHRRVTAEYGKCGDGSRDVVLTFVLPVGRPIASAMLTLECRLWAVQWFKKC